MDTKLNGEEQKIPPKNTSINFIIENEHKGTSGTKNPETNNMENESIENIKQFIFDFDIDINERIKAFMVWHDLPNEEIFELTNKLTTMYLFSGSSMIKQFLIAIIHTPGVKDIIKIEFAKTISCQTESKENFDLLDKTIQLIESTPIVILIECIILLMKSDDIDHIEHARDYFVAIINNTDHEEHFRYRTILSLEFRITDSEYFITEALLEFLDFDQNTSTYRILAGQALLQKYFADKNTPEDKTHINEFNHIRDRIQHILLRIMTDGELDINIRADAADVLLNLGTGVFKDQARDVILLLGAIDGTVRTVYQDGQNIHTTEIEKSALEILERLDDVEKQLTFEKARVIIQETAHKLVGNIEQDDLLADLLDDSDESKQTEEERMVTIALNRIHVDRQLYSQYSISLKGILLRVITFCNKHEHKDELYKRLIEELIDMHNKCSSGYAFRLVNTLSGYCEHTIRISWMDQIAGQLSGRLNAMIRAISDEDYKTNVLTELCLNTDSTISNRRNFLQFFRKAIPEIREAMWDDFKDDLTDTEFDLYLRRAIVKYEGGEWIDV